MSQTGKHPIFISRKKRLRNKLNRSLESTIIFLFIIISLKVLRLRIIEAYRYREHSTLWTLLSSMILLHNVLYKLAYKRKSVLCLLVLLLVVFAHRTWTVFF